MIKIEVTDSKTERFEGVGKVSNKPFSIRKQKAYAHLAGKKYPEEIELTLEDGQDPFQPGEYVLGPESLMVGRFGRLQIGRVYMRPVKGN